MEKDTSLVKVVTEGNGNILKPFTNSNNVELHPMEDEGVPVTQISSSFSSLNNSGTSLSPSLDKSSTSEEKSNHDDEVIVCIEPEIVVVAALEQMSPAEQWELKQQKKREMKMQNELREKIEAGCKIRQILASPDWKGSIDKLLIAKVKSRDWREVESIFALLKKEEYSKFSCQQACDEQMRGPLRIAVENKDIKMLELLLSEDIIKNEKIKILKDHCLYFAIACNFLEGVKLLLKREADSNLKICGSNQAFPAGTTPQILAAYHNNYEILSYLQTKLPIEIEKPPQNNMHFVLEDSYHLQMISKARSSPAYILALGDADRNFDTFLYCIKHIYELRQLAKVEHEFSNFYLQLVEDVEKFMCKLLDQIKTSADLAAIFEYDYDKRARTETLKYIFQSSPECDINNGLEEIGIGTRVRMLEKACDYKLVNFVTHHNPQLAIEHLTYRNTPFFRTGNHITFYLTRIMLALMFPVLSIFNIINPKSRAGRLITYPCTSYDCRMMSEFLFVVFLVTNISNKKMHLEYLAAPPTTWEVLILIWVMGKFVQEINELNKRGLESYFFDPWNHLDLWATILFAFNYAFRIVDYVKYHQVPVQQRPPRSEWYMFEWRLVAEGLMACAYVFVFIRLLGLTRVDRTLGPLQISLARMVKDVVQFLCIFAFILFAFALALTELYWFYGTPKGKEISCDVGVRSNLTNTTASCPEINTMFHSVWYSMIDLFWSLFGQLDMSKLSLSGKHLFTEYVAKALLAIYHVIAIIVLLNMLIAMMSRSYERTSENEEKEWKFQRTKMWIRILRREIIRPPPMNLLPSFKTIWYYLKRLKRLCCFFLVHLIRCRCSTIKRSFFPGQHRVKYQALNYHKARRNLISKYKTNILLSSENDCT
nr:short transient receptor potential channel 4-like [Ciona intestinalis]|eukprot:XP_018668390.1 short transient receptor potential channel 4-like [Ciona intestinalis]